MNNKITRRRSDYWLSLAIFGLIVFGLIMIYSVSKYYSLDLSNGQTDKLFLKKQLITAALGILAWVFFQTVDYRYWQKNAKYMLIATVGLLLLPMILAPLNLSHAGRWVGVGWAQFQPAEVAKLTFIFYISGLFAAQGKNLKKIAQAFLPFAVIVGSISLLMLVQKDLGTLAIFIAIASSIFIVAGAPLYQIFSGIGLAGFLFWLAIKLEPYRMARLTTFLNPDSGDAATYHIKNALIAIGSGGLFGLGFGQSKQKYLYLPEAHTDSIFAIICEELGLLRASLIILVFGFIAFRGIKIAKNAPDVFSRLVASGITVWLFLQMTVNIAAMFSLVPLTGVPLPFVSYGGSSLIVILAAVGVLTNISKFGESYARK
ncbi:MAG: putative peptidoglycan glycosyltransferase FtsW [Patescibacteria group bacterium]